MAITSFETTHALTETQWSKQLFKEVNQKTYFGKLIGKGPNAVIRAISDLESQPGDTVPIPKMMLLDQDTGIEGDGVLEGNEQNMNYGNDVITVEEYRNGVRWRKGLSLKRTARRVRDDSKEVLGIWKRHQTDNQIVKALSTSTTTNRSLEANDGNARKAQVGADIDNIATSDKLTVKAIQFAKVWARTGGGGSERMAGTEMGENGMETYLLYADPYAILDLKSDPDYKEFQKEDANARHHFFKGGIATIDGVVIIDCDKIQTETNATSVKVARNLFMGASAGAIAYSDPIFWNEAEYDYGKQCGVAIGDCKGVKKLRFKNEGGSDQEDQGVIQILTASVA